MTHTYKSSPKDQSAIILSRKLLAFIILTCCITSTIIISFMPAPLFLTLSTVACLGWAFHNPLLDFLGALKAEHQRDIHPNAHEEVVNLRKIKGFGKNTSLRVLYGNAANHEDIGEDNVIKFPRSTPSR